jgi:hypothetical protein
MMVFRFVVIAVFRLRLELWALGFNHVSLRRILGLRTVNY